MSDIVETLRQGSLTRDDYRWEAADLITALRAENEKLRAALREIAEENIGNTAAISVYIARAALEEK